MESLPGAGDVEAAAKALWEQGRAELEPRMDKVAREVETMVVRLMKNKEGERRDAEKLKAARGLVGTLINEGAGSLDQKSALPLELADDWKNGDGSVSEFQQKLAMRRKSLGMGKRKEKEYIDRVLAYLPHLAVQIEGAQKAFEGGQLWINQDVAALAKLEEDFQAIIADAWEVKDKVDQVAGGKGRENKLVDDLTSRVADHMKESANLVRWVQHGDGQIKIGRYNGWPSARAEDPKNEYYFDWYERAIKTDAEMDPRKKEAAEQ